MQRKSRIIKFSKLELEAIEMIGKEGLTACWGEPNHRKIRAAVGNLFTRGLVSRGKFINHYVMSELGKSVLAWNEIEKTIYG
jgi:hypothetical protein